jgi:hypothetical protein
MTDTPGQIRSIQCRAKLLAIQQEFGYDHFRREATAIVKARLQVDKNERPKHEQFKPIEYRRLYHRQKGICPICNLGMVMPHHWPGNLHMDRINPNLIEGYNAPWNRQVTHKKCNESKGGKSIQEQSKKTGKGFMELLGSFSDEPMVDEEI